MKAQQPVAAASCRRTRGGKMPPLRSLARQPVAAASCRRSAAARCRRYDEFNAKDDFHGHAGKRERRESRPLAQLHPRNHRGAQPRRAVRRPRAHPLSAGAERLPAHRPRQVDLPELRPGRRSTAASSTCATTTPTRPRKSRSTSIRSARTSAGSGPTGRTASSTPPTISTSSTSGPRSSSRRARRTSATCRPRRSPSIAAT